MSDNINILIVEDNRQMREMICQSIKHKCGQIYECADGREAFALYAKFRPDWVLMDWQMPDTDGITATREIIARFPNAKICLVTNYDDEFLKTEALEAGATGFVLKRNLAELELILVSNIEH